MWLFWLLVEAVCYVALVCIAALGIIYVLFQMFSSKSLFLLIKIKNTINFFSINYLVSWQIYVSSTRI